MPLPKRPFRLSPSETRAANTTEAARDLVDTQTAAREAQVKRLRLARLGRDSAAQASVPAANEPATAKGAKRK
ncbi:MULTISPECIES: hypothetical protein [unclassified Yoonia]|uniref:hypothetical protein n=1 Tax=unclassified Yoonia TaxID=2629118 RepID=UPI002AFDDFA8|nr:MULTISPECIES: hypothetical protein [unclassified Yoonia]